MKNKQLVIIKTDGNIELVMFVDAANIRVTEDAVRKARERYCTEEPIRRETLFDDVLFSILREKGVDYEYIEPYEIP